MGVMMLAASFGSKITVEAEGDDESEAIKKIQEIFESKFDED